MSRGTQLGRTRRRGCSRQQSDSFAWPVCSVGRRANLSAPGSSGSGPNRSVTKMSIVCRSRIVVHRYAQELGGVHPADVASGCDCLLFAFARSLQRARGPMSWTWRTAPGRSSTNPQSARSRMPPPHCEAPAVPLVRSVSASRSRSRPRACPILSWVVIIDPQGRGGLELVVLCPSPAGVHRPQGCSSCLAGKIASCSGHLRVVAVVPPVPGHLLLLLECDASWPVGVVPALRVPVGPHPSGLLAEALGYGRRCRS